jgi:hypothetical protein
MRTSHLLKLDNSQPPIFYSPLRSNSDGRIWRAKRQDGPWLHDSSASCKTMNLVKNYYGKNHTVQIGTLAFDFFTIVWPCIVTDPLWIKPTDALKSNFIGITTLHVSGSLSAHHLEFLAVHRLWYILLLVANGHHNCIKCTKADVRLRTPDDGQKGWTKHVES